jgi:hypothetical protein
MMWDAQRRAHELITAYRGNSPKKRARASSSDAAVDEALSLMAIQSHAELGRARTEHIPRNKMTWAHLADLVIRALKKDLCAAHDDDGLSETIERAVAHGSCTHAWRRATPTKGRA